MHKWEQGDDVVAFYIFRHGTKALGRGQAVISKTLGMPESSLIMRQRNFASLDRGSGLPNVAEQTRRIYERHRRTSEVDLHAAAIEWLDKKHRE